MLWLWISLILGRYERKERPSNRNAFLGSPENTFALKSHSPAQRRTMPTSHPNTLDFSNIALQHDAGDAFAALPVHVLITHVLSSGNLPDPSDLARLRAVSREMRDAVAATGREVYELGAEKAIELGDLSGMQLLHQRGDLDDELSDGLCTLAAEAGQHEILKWLRENDFPWDLETCRYAAAGGHLEVLQWARANGCPWDRNTSLEVARRGHLEVLQWARANGCPWNAETCTLAALGGHIEVLQWAHANGCPWNERTCSLAAREGNLELLQWARANGCPWNERTCSLAAREGHLELLQWARANGCPWDEETCSGAAYDRNLEVLQWARANGAPWDEKTCMRAASGGHLEVLQWARANGCPWSEWTCAMTARSGNLEGCSGRARTAARGTGGRARGRRSAGISR
jgi:hypothetical protein